MKCEYCLKDRETEHGCIETYTVRKRRLRAGKSGSDRVAYIDTIVREIKHSQVHPGWQPVTSLGLRHHAEAQRSLANGVVMQGGEVKPEWQ